MLKHPGRIFAAVAAFVLVLDQLTKWAVRAYLPVGDARSFLPGVLNLIHVRNVGAAFGLLPGFQLMFMLTSLLVLCGVAGYWSWARPNHPLAVVALALVCAGALGNFIDRALAGHVTDFLEFAFVEFPVFNVADIAISTGVTILGVWMVFFQPDEHATRPADDEARVSESVESGSDIAAPTARVPEAPDAESLS